MCLDRRLTVGAAGGHGPIRYTVQLYRPARHVRFRFDAPRGFDGHHEYEVLPDGENACRLRHSLVLTPHGVARLTWSLIFRPLHDALIEDSLDTAERSLGLPSPSPSRWPATVHVLRSSFRALAGIRRAV